MSTIALKGNTLGASLGQGSFLGVDFALGGAMKSVGNLSSAISSLKTKVTLVGDIENVDVSIESAQNAKDREEVKQGSLSLAYDKLDAFITEVNKVDNSVSRKVRERKDDFYEKYYYLKPECEKSRKEKIKDYVCDKLQALGDWIVGIGEAIANCFVAVVEWVKEHWVEVLKALTVALLVVASVLLLIFVPGGGLLSAVLLGAAKGCLIGIFTSVAINGVVNVVNGQNFWDGALDAAFTGAVEGFIGGAISGALVGNAASFGKAASKGLIKSSTTSFWGAVGRGAMVEASSSAISNAGAATLKYWFENGTLEGASGTIIQSAISGAVSGCITGGITEGIGYKIDMMKAKKVDTFTVDQTVMSEIDTKELPDDIFGTYQTANGGKASIKRTDNGIQLEFDKRTSELLQLSDKKPSFMKVTTKIDGEEVVSYKVVFEQKNLSFESAERMSKNVSMKGAKGSAAALGTDGQGLNMHHITREGKLTIYAELDNAYHEKMSSVLHRAIGSGSSFRNDEFLNKQFVNFESGYWNDRLYRILEDFTGSAYERTSKYLVLR